MKKKISHRVSHRDKSLVDIYVNNNNYSCRRYETILNELFSCVPMAHKRSYFFVVLPSYCPYGTKNYTMMKGAVIEPQKLGVIEARQSHPPNPVLVFYTL